MKVWVIMGNDFPDAVFSSEKAADKHVEKMKAETDKRPGGTPRIYWRSYEFTLRE